MGNLTFKSNSCVARAVYKLVKHQFNIDLNQSDIDAINVYNYHGNGIRDYDVVDAINNALSKYLINVKTVYACSIGDDFQYRDILSIIPKGSALPNAPMIVVLGESDHAETYTGHEKLDGTARCAFVLDRY